MEAGKIKIREILNPCRMLEIPFFQRSYVWEEDQWDRFLQDMEDVSNGSFNKEYFLGFLFTKQKETSIKVGDVRTVVDGQQRLTTLAILFRCLYPVEDSTGDFDKIFRTYGNETNELTIAHNHYDREPFEAVLNGKIADVDEKYSDSKIIKCYEHIKNSERLKNIKSKEILDNVYFINIDLTKDENEQQIFDTINSLGVGLSTAELLKNSLYGPEDEKEFNTTWKKEFEVDGKEFWDKEITSGRMKKTNIDLLVQSFLDVKREEGTGATSNSDGNGIYITDHRKWYNKETFRKQLLEYAELYKENINKDFTKQKVTSNIERINIIVFGLQTTTIISYLLHIIKYANGNEGLRDEMIRLIESYLIRRMVCKITTKRYNLLFSELLKDIIKNKELNYKFLKTKFSSESETDRFPPNPEFEGAIAEKEISNKNARVFLYLLESHMSKGEIESKDIKGFITYTLEHVLPVKWEAKEGWVNDLIGKDLSNEVKQLEKNKFNRLKSTLGNMTIIPKKLNSSISNSPWHTKVKGDNKKKGLAEYGDIKIFKDYLDLEKYDKWDEKTINSRAEKLLAKEALQAWPDLKGN